MKTKRFLLVFSLIFVAILLVSCGTTQEVAENVDDSGAPTFVNTVVQPDGKIFTRCVFTKITGVVTNRGTAKEKKIDANKCEYNDTTGEVTLPEKVRPDTSVHVEGVYKNPPTFMLNNLDPAFKKPCVMKEGKLLKADKDYVFDESTRKIEFKVPLDPEKDSFQIVWFSTYGAQFFGNKFEEYESEYSKALWLGEIWK